MIKSQDRSGWIGASDTSYVVGNWETQSFKNWWSEKLAFRENTFTSDAMRAGTEYEHAILDLFPCVKDEQLIIEDLRLRVNYDGTGNDFIKEIKTYKDSKVFKVSKAYWRQAQVEMFCFLECKGILPTLDIVAYPLSESEYNNFFIDIDVSKISSFRIEYDKEFIEKEYLPKLCYLAECLKRGCYPDGNKIQL